MHALIDSHCHLDRGSLESGWETAWKRAELCGIRAAIVPGVDRDGFTRVAEMVARGPFHPAVGLHPWTVASQGFTRDDADALRLAAQQPGVCALGECGLDDRAPAMDVQRAAFTAQLEIARALELPVIVHAVGAHEEVLATLERMGPLRAGGVMHAYSGGASRVQRVIACGLSVSFGPAVTRVNARRQHAAVRAVPASRLLIETDAPDQRPADSGRAHGEPADLLEVARAVAVIRGETLEQVAEVTVSNSRALFGI